MTLFDTSKRIGYTLAAVAILLLAVIPPHWRHRAMQQPDPQSAAEGGAAEILMPRPGLKGQVRGRACRGSGRSDDDAPA